MCSSHARRSSSLDPKWCRSSPGDTPAVAAIPRIVVRSYPSSAKCLIAASRIRARPVRSFAAGETGVD